MRHMHKRTVFVPYSCWSFRGAHIWACHAVADMQENLLKGIDLCGVTRAFGAPDKLSISKFSTHSKHQLITTWFLLTQCPQCFEEVDIARWGGGVITLCFLRSCQNSVFLHLQTFGMVCWHLFLCTCKHAGWCAGTYFFALANMRDGTLGHLLLHLQTCGMVCWDILACMCKHA